MKTQLRSLVVLLAFLPAVPFAADSTKNCGCACCKGKEVCCCNTPAATDTPKKPDDAMRYPLRGVIVKVQSAESSLLVKHEKIPGLMPGMTMSFKVDAATLKAARAGQAITATLVQRDDSFVLEDVKPAAIK